MKPYFPLDFTARAVATNETLQDKILIDLPRERTMLGPLEEEGLGLESNDDSD